VGAHEFALAPVQKELYDAAKAEASEHKRTSAALEKELASKTAELATTEGMWRKKMENSTRDSVRQPATPGRAPRDARIYTVRPRCALTRCSFRSVVLHRRWSRGRRSRQRRAGIRYGLAPCVIPGSHLSSPERPAYTHSTTAHV
jgi:hypothetical protein